MERDVYKMLGWTGEKIDQFEKDGGTLEKALKSTDEKTRKALGNPMVKIAVKRVQAAKSLIPWAEKWRLMNFLKEAGPYELRVTKTQNPFYPMIAFGASMDACLDLGVVATPHVLAHAVVFDLIRRNNGSVSKAVADNELRKRGLLDIDASTCDVFDMHDHPLRDVDLETMSSAEAMKKAGPTWGGLAAIREKRCMQNDIVLENDVYTRKRNVSPLVAHIVRLLRSETE